MMVLTITRVSGDNVCCITCHSLHDMTLSRVRLGFYHQAPRAAVSVGSGLRRVRHLADHHHAILYSILLYCHCIVLYDHGRGLLVPDVVVLDGVGQLVAPVPSVEEAAGAGARPVTLVTDIIMVYTV